jgi:hypothetical protein
MAQMYQSITNHRQGTLEIMRRVNEAPARSAGRDPAVAAALKRTPGRRASPPSESQLMNKYGQALHHD